MADEENEAQVEPRRHRVQVWTVTGYPVVDDRYINLETETLETLPANGALPVFPGPPHLRIVWNNMAENNELDAFRGVGLTGFVTNTEWIRRLGSFLERLGDGMKIESLNVTQYGVYVFSVSDLNGVVVMDAMRRAGICPAKREIPTDVPEGELVPFTV